MQSNFALYQKHTFAVREMRAGLGSDLWASFSVRRLREELLEKKREPSGLPLGGFRGTTGLNAQPSLARIQTVLRDFQSLSCLSKDFALCGVLLQALTLWLVYLSTVMVEG